MPSAAEAFQALRRAAADDPDVLGFAVTGSRSRGLEDAHSDYDCALFVRDGCLADFQARYADLPPGVDLRIFTLESFREHAAWGGPTAWDRYGWAHVHVEADRTGGELQRLAGEKARVPPDRVREYVAGSLDGYLNQAYRSLKCLRAGNGACFRLEAAESVRPLLQALFAVHGGRLVPYHRYLEWELERAPLDRLAMSGGELVRHLLAGLADGAPESQRTLAREAERLFRAEGYGDVFDGWGTKLHEAGVL